MRKFSVLSVVGCRGLTVWVIFLLGGVINQNLGQQLRYSFEQGEILDYELVAERVDGNTHFSRNLKQTWKYQFSVDQAGNNAYRMTMTLISNFANELFTQENRIVRSNYSSSFEQQFGAMSKLVNIEISNPISFVLDTMGNILEMNKLDLLMKAIVDEAAKSPEIKGQMNFAQLKIRYSPDYYKWIIHEFFPALPGSYQDTIDIRSDNRILARINNWSAEAAYSDTLPQINLKRAYFFTPADTSYSFMKVGRENQLSITWPKNSGHPVKINYDGFLPESFINHGVLLNGTFLHGYFNLSEIRHINITNSNSSINQNNSVKISGALTNFKDMELTAVLPGNGITKRKLPVVLSEDGSFSITFDPKMPAGFVELHYNQTHEYQWFSPMSPKQIRLFVKPGDSIHFTADLKDSTKLAFSGPSAADQLFLNSLSKALSPRNFQLCINTTLENSKRLELQKNRVSQDLYTCLATENKYSLLSYQVKGITQNRYTGTFLNEYDSLSRFVKYLGYANGYQSDAYKEFLCDYVEINYEISATGKVKAFRGSASFELASAILSGWDLYWYLALLTEMDLKDFPISNSDEYYKRYSEMYPGTDYQTQLFNLRQANAKFKIGNTLPSLKFEDLSGKIHSTGDFQGEYWAIVNLDKSLGMNDFLLRMADTIQHLFAGKIKFVVCSPNSTPQELMAYESMIRGNKVLILPNSAKNKAILDYLKDLPKMLIGIDGEGRIASYDQSGMSQLESLLSWPVSTPPSKTINLKVFWYSMGGAFILTNLIVLLLRFRSKRMESRLILKRKMAQLEVDAVRSRMNPHFLFNALSSIQNLINNKQIEEANLFLARFGELVRTILSQSSKPAIGLNEEIDMIRNYLQLEQLRFPFLFDIQIDSAIDIFAIEVPPLLIQPHVENAVMHGISGLGRDGRIMVIFRAEQNHLICEVKDNGPGYHPEKSSGNGGLGQGWKLTRQRIQLMMEQYGEDVSVEVSDNRDSSGTTVIFRLPMQNSSL
jgi:anti-sigma regulatory factor (Ser/Thr protein kinase)